MTEVVMREGERPVQHPLILDIEDLPWGAAVIDRGGLILEANATLCDLLGRRSEDLRSTCWSDLAHPDDRDREHLDPADSEAGTIGRRFLRPDGEVVWVGVEVAEVPGDLAAGGRRLVHLVDLTGVKEREASLEALAADQTSLADRSAHLENAKASLLTALSHELRTPVTLVNGVAESLTRFGQGLSEDARQRLESMLLRHAKRLASLLDDILDLDRLASGDLTFDAARTDVVALTRELVDGSSVADRARVQAPAELVVTTDRDRFAVIVNNLLSNAAKYAPEGPVVVEVAALAGGGCTIEVLDQGPGIPHDERDAVFRPFHRLPDEHASPGTGIGLALVARLSSLHGGSAAVLDRPVGAHVRVVLPDLPTTGPAPLRVDGFPRDVDPRPSGNGDQPAMGSASEDQRLVGRLLLVDDDPQVRSMFRAALVHAGHEVTAVADAEQASQVLSAETFDLALVDMQLPDLDGAGLVSLVRADPRHESMNIVFVSGDTSTDSKLAGLAAGGSDYLVKPVPLRELLGRVEAHLRQRATWEQLLERSMRDRLQVAGQIRQLSTTGSLGAFAAALRRLIEREVPIEDAELAGDREAAFDLIAHGERTRIRMPLEHASRQLGALDVTVASEYAQRACSVLVDLAPHIAAAAAPLLEAESDAEDAEAWFAWLQADGTLTSVFQPVVQLADRQVVGYEALARFADGTSPSEVFDLAKRRGVGAEVEMLALARHLAAAEVLEGPGWLSVNVSAQVLLSLQPDDLVGANRDLVLELTEYEPVVDYPAISSHLAALPGVRLAVDDAGAGYASLRHILELSPDLIKLDRRWVRDIHQDPVRRSLVEGLVGFAAAMEGRVVAEGIESGAELQTLTDLGVDLGQGFYLGRPAPR